MEPWRAELYSNLAHRRELYLAHHGIKGQKWGVRRGPPYPIDDKRSEKSQKKSGVDNHKKSGKISNTVVKDAIASGEVSSKINPDKQIRHLRIGHTRGRSYLDGDMQYAQRLVDQLAGTGSPVVDKNGNWLHKERVASPHIIGTHVDSYEKRQRPTKL